jgi:hypothetical protein
VNLLERHEARRAERAVLGVVKDASLRFASLRFAPLAPRGCVLRLVLDLACVRAQKNP